MSARSSLFAHITLSRILVIIAMVAILGLITYASLPSTPSIIIDTDNHIRNDTIVSGDIITGDTMAPLSTGEENISGDIMTGINHNTETIAIYPAKYLVDTHEYDGSCTALRVEDDHNTKISVPAEITESLHCAGGSETLSHNYRFLLYGQSSAPDYKTTNLKIYDFTNKKTQTLMSFNNTMDGISCQWRDDDSYIACVVINQKEYSGSTKVFILQINANGSLAKKQVFPQTNETRVGFHCASTCYPSDFRWEGTHILQYEGQDNGDDILTGETYSIKYE